MCIQWLPARPFSLCLLHSSEKMWKRVINKISFVGDNFTRKPPKFERYIRPSGLRFKKAHVTHPELKTTFCLDIVSVKKNPQSQLYTSLGVITKGEERALGTAKWEGSA